MIRLGITLALALSLGGTAGAQVAVIHGKLQDAEGKPVAGFPIILENAESAARGYSGNIGFTSETGDFTVAVDQPGQYDAILPNVPGGILGQFEVAPNALQAGSADPGQDIGTIKLPALDVLRGAP